MNKKKFPHRKATANKWFLAILCVFVLPLLVYGQTNEWTHLKGYGKLPWVGAFGTPGVASDEHPGSIKDAVTWQLNGKLYLFGGNTSDGTTTNDNDRKFGNLWEYEPTTKQWKWLKGFGATLNAAGIYGTMGVEAATNMPSARIKAQGWQYNGKLYLFGGSGYGESNTLTIYLNDLWVYDPATNNWTWIKGSKTQVPTDSGSPGGRHYASIWEQDENIYVFGGETITGARMSDLWKYNAVANTWQLIKGTTTANQNGTYGTINTEASDNKPGARHNAIGWAHNNRLYLFGGNGRRATTTSNGTLNDIWEFNLSTNNWTWIKGTNTFGIAATYGTLQTSATSNTPGAREQMVKWKNDNKFYFFGGSSAPGTPYFNDIWEFDPSSKNWTWIKGNNTTGGLSIYNDKDVATVANTPGARVISMGWYTNGELFLLGGYGFPETTPAATLHDMWVYQHSTNNWAWIGGNRVKKQYSVFGTKGVADAANIPEARKGATSWMSGGKLYLFGGNNETDNGEHSRMNDLWEYDPQTSNWTWLKGSNTINALGVYGTIGQAHANNTPGARRHAAGWEKDGKLYLFGGYGYPETGGIGHLNDLWEYDIATQNWKWLKGTKVTGSSGSEGFINTANASNFPRARFDVTTWTSNGKFYMFGGHTTSANWLNQVWEYNPQNNMWVWIKGSSLSKQAGTYGIKNSGADNTTPGTRHGASGWAIGSKLYLYGGEGYTTNNTTSGWLNDVWEFDIETKRWTWIAGSDAITQAANYGTKGVAAGTNTPGSREGAAAWIAGGKLHLFGGNKTGFSHFMNDLWEFDIQTNEWTWLGGDNVVDKKSIYNKSGVAEADNIPGARFNSAVCQTPTTVYLFGGDGYNVNSALLELGDLWSMNITTTTLPVNIVAFTVKAENNRAKLQWRTAKENNNKEFIIYRSNNYRIFKKIDEVVGAGNSSMLKEYSLYDLKPQNGNNYYKLTQVDFDGKEKELGVVSLFFGINHDINVFPNPTSDIIRISLQANNFTKAEIKDTSGKIILNQGIDKADTELNFNIESYPTGVYILTISGLNNSISKKIIKQ